MNSNEIEARYHAEFEEIGRAMGAVEPAVAALQEQCFSIDDEARRIDRYLSLFGAEPVFSATTGTGTF